MNKTDNDLNLEIESLKKNIEELKIEENVFNGVSIDLYAAQREVDNLTYLLMDAEKTINDILKNHKETQNKLEKLLEEIKIYTSKRSY